jgi:two-component system KDP operon response regulator KdpE
MLIASTPTVTNGLALSESLQALLVETTASSKFAEFARPLLVVLGAGPTIETIRLALATFAASRHVLRPDQLTAEHAEASAIVVCGLTNRILEWHQLIHKIIPHSTVTVGALRRYSSRAVAHLLDSGLKDVINCEMASIEIVARLRSLIRLHVARAAQKIDPAAPVLRQSQIRLYDYFRRNPARIIGQRELISEVFGGAHSNDTSLVRVHMAALRKSLGTQRDLIKTIRGLGYCYVPVGWHKLPNSPTTVDGAAFSQTIEESALSRTVAGS